MFCTQVTFRSIASSLLLAAMVLFGPCTTNLPAQTQADPEPAVTSKPAADKEPEISTEDRKEILDAWRDASMQYVINDMIMRPMGLQDPNARMAWILKRRAMQAQQQQYVAAQQKLLNNARVALQVLLEDKYPLPKVTPQPGQIDTLIKDFRDDSWRVREQASLKLRAIGRPARAALRACAQDGDLEVRARAEEILNPIVGEERARIERLAAQSIIGNTSLETLLPLARKYFLVLAEDESQMNFNTLLRDPLLGALRYSTDAYDRDLIALAREMSNDGNRRYFDQYLIDKGLPMPQFGGGCYWRQPPPQHDYTGAMNRLVDDPRSAQILAKTLQYVPRDAKTLDRLKTLRGKTKDKAILDEIDKYTAAGK